MLLETNPTSGRPQTEAIYLSKAEAKQYYTAKGGVQTQASPGMRGSQRAALNHLHRLVLLVLCFHLANYLVLSFYPTGPRALPDLHAHLLAKMDSKAEHCRKVIQNYYGWHPLSF